MLPAEGESRVEEQLRADRCIQLELLLPAEREPRVEEKLRADRCI
jgi:hypothetical protein